MQRLARAVIGGALQRNVALEKAAQDTRQIQSAREQDGQMVEPRGGLCRRGPHGRRCRREDGRASGRRVARSGFPNRLDQAPCAGVQTRQLIAR